MHIYMATLPQLYTMQRKQIVMKESCGGTLGPKKEKYDCSGTAAILLEFEEAVVKSSVEMQLNDLSSRFRGLALRMQSPMPASVCSAIAFLENLYENVLKRYSRYVTRNCTERDTFQNVGVAYFFTLCDLVNEDSVSCPPIRHFFSSSLQALGDGVIANNLAQCLSLLETLLENSARFELIATFFVPRKSKPEEYLKMYKLICEMPASDSHQQFVLLTKMAFSDWLRDERRNFKHCSVLICQIGVTLKEFGVRVPHGRETVHDTLKRHLMVMADTHFEEHYNEVSNFHKRPLPVHVSHFERILFLFQIVNMINQMSEQHSIDPMIWYDVINVTFKIGWRGIESEKYPVPKISVEEHPDYVDLIRIFRYFVAMPRTTLYQEDVS